MAKGFYNDPGSKNEKQKTVRSTETPNGTKCTRKKGKTSSEHTTTNFELEDSSFGHTTSSDPNFGCPRTCILCGIRPARASFICCYSHPVLCLECEKDEQFCPNCGLDFLDESRR